MQSLPLRSPKLIWVPALVLGAGLLGRLYSVDEADAPRPASPEAAALTELSQRAERGEILDPRDFERLAIRLRALELAAAETKKHPAEVAAGEASPPSLERDSDESAAVPTPEEWYETRIADKPYDPGRTREVQATATTFLSRLELAGTQLTASECYDDICALHFQSQSPSDLAALQLQLAQQSPFENTSLLFAFDKKALRASIHLEPTQSVSVAAIE